MSKNIMLIVIVLSALATGIAIGYGAFHKKPIPYIPGTEVHRLDSINSNLKDSISFWKEKQNASDRILKQQDSIINIQKAKYEKLRKKISDANADDSNAILNGFLSIP